MAGFVAEPTSVVNYSTLAQHYLSSDQHFYLLPSLASGTVLNEEMILVTQSLKELQLIMSNYVGIVRSDLRLKRALDRLEIIYRENPETKVKVK